MKPLLLAGVMIARDRIRALSRDGLLGGRQ